MKVIFLDFNGVLDTWENWDVIDLGNLKRLKQIIQETGAKIVVSSSLKNTCVIEGYISNRFKEFIQELNKEGVYIMDITPRAKTREMEIQLYLKMHPGIENFCILDDDYDMEIFQEHMVKLPHQMNDGANGLDDEHMLMAIDILNFKYKNYVRK